MLLVTEMVHGGVDSIRAPRGNNLAAIAPDRSSLRDLLAANRAFWRSIDVPSWIQGVRAIARRQLVSIARDYANSYLPGSLYPSPDLSEDGTWILGGHQAELFHPGVWFKNILIDRLARETHSFGLHAIIDHDLARMTSLRVPARDSAQGRAHAAMIPLPLIRPSTPDTFLPWNAWQIDRSKIRDTGEAIGQALQSVGINRSMAADYFHQLQLLPKDRNAAIAFSQVRHRMERRHGIGNWEFPISHLCRGEAWRMFVDHCIVHAIELNQTYNACLDEYRASEGVTNPAQPVPRLGRHGEWIELPFWIRLPGQFARRRMWVSHRDSRWQIAPEPDSTVPTIPWGDGFWDDSWLVWPRALTTTLFLRTFVADLFVHGIGGGQYDRLTDAIIARFLRIVPPKFVTCTASLWLSFPNSDFLDDHAFVAYANALESERQRLRSCPEHYLDARVPEQKNLADAHRQLLTRIPPRGQKKQWDGAMRRLKAQIVAAIDVHRRDWDACKAALEAKAIEQRILQSREFSYVLFEEQDILDRLLKLSSG